MGQVTYWLLPLAVRRVGRLGVLYSPNKRNKFIVLNEEEVGRREEREFEPEDVESLKNLLATSFSSVASSTSTWNTVGTHHTRGKLPFRADHVATPIVITVALVVVPAVLNTSHPNDPHDIKNDSHDASIINERDIIDIYASFLIRIPLRIVRGHQFLRHEYTTRLSGELIVFPLPILSIIGDSTYCI